MVSMKTIVETIHTTLLRTKSHERILIVCDKKTKKLAEDFLEYGYGFGSSTLCFEVPVGTQNGEEPSKEVAKLMLEFDILLLITTKSLSHTNARKGASAKGKRITTIPSGTPEMLKRCIPIDYELLANRNKKLYQALKKTTWVRITTKLGTDIKFKIYTDKIQWQTTLHKKGDFHNLPYGEVYVSPLEGTAEGTYVVDGSQAGIGLLRKPIAIAVKKGKAISFTGGVQAKKFAELVKGVGKVGAYNIAELGIGTNPKAKITGNVLEDEKILGTCHIALGNNYSFGGKVNVPFHVDGVMSKPTIYCDEKIIMKHGKFLL